MQQQPQAAEFGIADAKRVLGEVFAPWVMDLNLSIEGFDCNPPGDADWQPGCRSRSGCAAMAARFRARR